MTIKSHIAISAIISLALIALIACQQKPQAPKEEKGLNDKIKTQVTKVEDTAKKAQEATAKAEAEAKEAATEAKERSKEIEEILKEEEEKAKAKAKEAEAKAKEAENKAKDKIKEIETKVNETSEKVKSTVNDFANEVEGNTEAQELLGPVDIFENNDFGEGLKGWSSTPGVSFVQDEDKKFIELTGQEDKQTRVWQKFNATAGHVYRLTFKAKSEQEGAFAIFRDDEADKEKYLYTDRSSDWKEYSKDFTATKDGDYRLFLSCQGDGKYYYKDASLVDITDTNEEK